jgi:hypothetical protein
LKRPLFSLFILAYLTLGIFTIGHAESSFISLPTPPKAKSPYSATQACVAPTPEIRRFHGQYLKHQRDDTMHRGIRTPQYSLVGCISCHVVPNDQGQYPTLQTPEHFCQTCHSYAAVNIDCFQCHASQPDLPTAELNQNNPDDLGYTSTIK